MTCNHELGICFLRFDPDPSLEELIRRLRHVFPEWFR